MREISKGEGVVGLGRCASITSERGVLGEHEIQVVWLSARAPGKLGNKEERGV